MEAKAKSSNVKNSIVSGLISGSITATTLQPFEFVKTKLQLPREMNSRAFEQQRTIRGILCHTVLDSKTNKISFLNARKLWTGLTPSLMRTVPVAGVYFGTIDLLKNSSYLSHSVNGGKYQLLHSLLIGVIARTVADTFTHPIGLVKTRYESGTYKYKSVLTALQTIYRAEGFTGLYRGLGATLLRDISYSGLYFALYTKNKQLIREFYTDQNADSSLATSAGFYASCALVSSALACALTQPSDVARSYMQLDPGQFNSFVGTLRVIYARHGVAGFFAGFLPRASRRVLISVLGWTIYEKLSIKN
jgi:solute carrier family 25 protein 38